MLVIVSFGIDDALSVVTYFLSLLLFVLFFASPIIYLG